MALIPYRVLGKRLKEGFFPRWSFLFIGSTLWTVSCLNGQRKTSEEAARNMPISANAETAHPEEDLREEEAEADLNTLLPPTNTPRAQLRGFKIPGEEVPQLLFSLQGADFLAYEACATDKPRLCLGGELRRSGDLIASLPVGPYRLLVQLCNRSRRLPKQIACGPQEALRLVQKPPNDQGAMVLKQIDQEHVLTQKIDAKTAALLKRMAQEITLLRQKHTISEDEKQLIRVLTTHQEMGQDQLAELYRQGYFVNFRSLMLQDTQKRVDQAVHQQLMTHYGLILLIAGAPGVVGGMALVYYADTLSKRWQTWHFGMIDDGSNYVKGMAQTAANMVDTQIDAVLDTVNKTLKEQIKTLATQAPVTVDDIENLLLKALIADAPDTVTLPRFVDPADTVVYTEIRDEIFMQHAKNVLKEYTDQALKRQRGPLQQSSNIKDAHQTVIERLTIKAEEATTLATDTGSQELARIARHKLFQANALGIRQQNIRIQPKNYIIGLSEWTKRLIDVNAIIVDTLLRHWVVVKRASPYQIDTGVAKGTQWADSLVQASKIQAHIHTRNLFTGTGIEGTLKPGVIPAKLTELESYFKAIKPNISPEVRTGGKVVGGMGAVLMFAGGALLANGQLQLAQGDRDEVPQGDSSDFWTTMNQLGQDLFELSSLRLQVMEDLAQVRP